MRRLDLILGIILPLFSSFTSVLAMFYDVSMNYLCLSSVVICLYLFIPHILHSDLDTISGRRQTEDAYGLTATGSLPMNSGL